MPRAKCTQKLTRAHKLHTNTNDLSDWNESDISDIVSSDGDAVLEENKWSERIMHYIKEPFKEPTGPTIPLPNTAQPIDYFLHLFPDSVFRR